MLKRIFAGLVVAVSRRGHQQDQMTGWLTVAVRWVALPMIAVSLLSLLPVLSGALAADSNLIEKFLQSEGVTQSPTVREIPLTACPTTGQSDEAAPRLPATTRALLAGDDRGGLAFYSAVEDGRAGVLAPRGWMCIQVVGSNGDSLIVAPPEAAAAPQDLVQTGNDRSTSWSGPSVVVHYGFGGTSGRMDVANLSARLFPKAAKFVNQVRAWMRTEGMEDEFVFQPWPSDRLDYLSDALVKYETSGPEGLGYQAMTPGPSPIRGIAALLQSFQDDPTLPKQSWVDFDMENAPDSAQLAVRLDASDASLYPVIAAQFISSIADNLPSNSEREAQTRTLVGTASAFYQALGRADGYAAQEFLVPEKRGRGNFEPAAMSRFYSALSEPLVLQVATQTSGDQVIVRYRFRGAAGICDGAATLTLRKVGMDFLIESIRARNAC